MYDWFFLFLTRSYSLSLVRSLASSLFWFFSTFLSFSRFSSFTCSLYTALLIHRFFFLPFGFDLIFLCIGNLFSNPTNNRTRVISSVAFLIFTGVCTIVNHVFVFAMGTIKKKQASARVRIFRYRAFSNHFVSKTNKLKWIASEWCATNYMTWIWCTVHTGCVYGIRIICAFTAENKK